MNNGTSQNNGSLFRFLNHLVNHPLFLDKVADSWSKWVPGVPMFRVVQKLWVVKGAMKILNKLSGHVSDLVFSR